MLCQEERERRLVRLLNALPEAADRIATLEAEVERLREVVERGAAWFVEYADQHEAKSRIAHGGEVVARREKTKRNRERANYLLAALKDTDLANQENSDHG